MSTDFSLVIIMFGVPLIAPIIIGVILLIRFKKYRFGLLAAIFTLKPIIAYPIWFFVYSNYYDNRNIFLAASMAILPGVVLTLIIIYKFRSLFNFKINNWAAWLLLSFDTLRWVGVYLYSLGGDSPISKFIDVYSISSALMMSLNPTLYSFIALFLIVILGTTKMSKEEKDDSSDSQLQIQ